MLIPKFTSCLDLFLLFNCLHFPTTFPRFLPTAVTHFPLQLSRFQVPSAVPKPLPDQYLSFNPSPTCFLSFPLISHLISVQRQKFGFSLLPILSTQHQISSYPLPPESSPAPMLPAALASPLPHPFEFQWDDSVPHCPSCGREEALLRRGIAFWLHFVTG